MSDDLDDSALNNDSPGLVVIKPGISSLSKVTDKFLDLLKAKSDKVRISDAIPSKNAAYYNGIGLKPAKIVLSEPVEKDGVLDYTQENLTSTKPTEPDYKLTAFMSAGFGITVNTLGYQGALQLQEYTKRWGNSEEKDQANYLIQIERENIQKKILDKHAYIQDRTGVNAIEAMQHEVNHHCYNPINFLSTDRDFRSSEKSRMLDGPDLKELKDPRSEVKKLPGPKFGV